LGLDGVEGGFGLGAVGAAGLGHVRAAAAAFAAERCGADLYEVDGAIGAGEVLRDADRKASLAVLGDPDDGDDA
jgi:hypothetical protein